MKKTIIRTIGILLIVLGTLKAYTCLSVVASYVPIAFEYGLERLGLHAALLNLTMAAIGLTKVVGGVGLLWLKPWAKWIAAIAAMLHALFLTCFQVYFWTLVLRGMFDWLAGYPIWKDFATIGVNLLTVIALFLLFKKPKKNENAQQAGPAYPPQGVGSADP